ncbi:Fatty acid 2-hydroxylase 1 [Abeliophyllum distichum]|uniref:Fatty acid 2-hydroxylase 1 n=1 Tax=Abeliophyllum distichum TaxID=126358 RepID=A0ABD1QFA7_9LAMI
MVAQDFTVDLNKPLVFQVGHLGEAYQEWVHQPIVSKEGPRFFESDFWEFLTLTEWFVIPLIWLPVVGWFISKSIRMELTIPQVVLAVAFGIFIWTLLEYTLHRFLFHIKTKSYWGNTIHYLIHGCHHKHPMDGLRLVFPPAATAILLVPIWNLIKVMATPTAPALFAGGLLGYVMYDVTHYYLHHGQPTSEVPKGLKKYHLNHHFRIQDKGFGITSSLWDKAFGTLPPLKLAKNTCLASAMAYHSLILILAKNMTRSLGAGIRITMPEVEFFVEEQLSGSPRRVWNIGFHQPVKRPDPVYMLLGFSTSIDKPFHQVLYVVQISILWGKGSSDSGISSILPPKGSKIMSRVFSVQKHSPYFLPGSFRYWFHHEM